MALTEVKGVRMDGVAVCVPSSVKDVNHLFTDAERKQFVRATGIKNTRIGEPDKTTGDYARTAAERLISDMGIDRSEIDLLIFVSQTPDYHTPMTSCILQSRLNLSKNCMAFDVTSGCSGYVQGLNIAACMLEGGKFRRALLLAGDTTEKQISRLDKTVYPLFGDAASATLLSYDAGSPPICFELGTDGCGAQAIMIPDGGGRNPFSHDSLDEHEIEKGVVRNRCHLLIDGEDVFSFAISEVPDSIERLYDHFSLDMGKTDYFIFHQANKMILETIADVLDIPIEKVPMSLSDFGNTSSASIPLTLVSQIGSISKPTTLCLSGFGVGLSWGSAYMQTDRLFCSQLIEGIDSDSDCR